MPSMTLSLKRIVSSDGAASNDAGTSPSSAFSFSVSVRSDASDPGATAGTLPLSALRDKSSERSAGSVNNDDGIDPLSPRPTSESSLKFVSESNALASGSVNAGGAPASG